LKISALKLTVALEIIYSCILSTKNLNTIFKFDHVEVWKILCRKASGFFQELEATTLTKYFTVGEID